MVGVCSRGARDPEPANRAVASVMELFDTFCDSSHNSLLYVGSRYVDCLCTYNKKYIRMIHFGTHFLADAMKNIATNFRYSSY